MSIIIFIIILLVLVLVHEFGHFYSAKKFGIRVDEFGFGFPPKLFGKKYGETEYSLNLFPIGGFVKIFGENPDDENTNGPDKARSFVHQAKWKQAIVLVAGVFMNFLLAWFLFTVGFLSGTPTSVNSDGVGQEINNVNLTVVSVVKKSPAQLAGIKAGDKIVCLGNSTADYSCSKDLSYLTPEYVKSFVVAHDGKTIDISYLRGSSDKVNIVSVTPVNSMIGIAMDKIGIVKFGLFGAIKEGAVRTYFVTKGTIVGLYTLVADAFQGKGSLSAVTGPVGMVSIVGDAYQFGFSYLLSFAALISINLAVINLLPFPALDGGRLFFLLIEKIKGSRLNPKFANTTNMIGFGLLIILMVVITFHDIIVKFF